MAQPALEWTQAGFTISTDRDRLDRPAIHRFLSEEAYWSLGIPRETLDRALDHSICFGLYDERGTQVGFARVITDRATFASLSDVFVLDTHRGQGLGVWLVGTILTHPDLQGLRRFTLGTKDAQGLYERFGFAPHPHPAGLLEIYQPAPALYEAVADA